MRSDLRYEKLKGEWNWKKKFQFYKPIQIKKKKGSDLKEKKLKG